MTTPAPSHEAADGRKPISVPLPVHQRVAALAERKRQAKGRAVPFYEVIEDMLDVYEEVTG